MHEPSQMFTDGDGIARTAAGTHELRQSR
ncbi:MAG: hypothetical protein QOD29_1093, partial [Alphaproteobacteria bacterium]|jgi:hypothetical protein|nr:hypothetical protein [Alphaproteobacteria bacterium]